MTADIRIFDSVPDLVHIRHHQRGRSGHITIRVRSASGTSKVTVAREWLPRAPSSPWTVGGCPVAMRAEPSRAARRPGPPTARGTSRSTCDRTAPRVQTRLFCQTGIAAAAHGIDNSAGCHPEQFRIESRGLASKVNGGIAKLALSPAVCRYIAWAPTRITASPWGPRCLDGVEERLPGVYVVSVVR